MRIIQLTPGSGDNFYCENCLRDLTLVRAFQRAGHDVMMVPMYLPIKTGGEPFPTRAPIFFGGVNVYLQQKFGVFQKTPRWLDKMFDVPFLLKSVGKLAGMTSPKDLGETTISMLKGENGRQQKELLRLADWLVSLQPRPDVIIVSNILLAGMVRILKEKLGIPVVCLLQDEEGFLDTLPVAYAEQGWHLVREHAAVFDALICVSEYYQQVMAERLETPIEKLPTISIGLDVSAFDSTVPVPPVPTIGFLSKMCYDYGLDILINTLHLLRHDDRLKDTRLCVTGGRGPGDKIFLKKMQNRINAIGLADAVEYVDDYSDAARQRFLQNISVMVLPSRKPLAYGLFAMEACAVSRPFVVPDLGVFAELVKNTQAGITYEPNNPVKLADVLRSLLTDPRQIRRLGQNGRKAVETSYSIDETVAKLTVLFSSLCNGDSVQKG